MKSASHNGKFKAPTLSALIQCGESGALNSPRGHLDRTEQQQNSTSTWACKAEAREGRGGRAREGRAGSADKELRKFLMRLPSRDIECRCRAQHSRLGEVSCTEETNNVSCGQSPGTRPEPARTGPTRPDLTRTCPTQRDLPRPSPPDQTRSDPARSSARPSLARPDPPVRPRRDQTRPDLTGPRTT